MILFDSYRVLDRLPVVIVCWLNPFITYAKNLYGRGSRYGWLVTRFLAKREPSCFIAFQNIKRHNQLNWDAKRFKLQGIFKIWGDSHKLFYFVVFSVASSNKLWVNRGCLLLDCSFEYVAICSVSGFGYLHVSFSSRVSGLEATIMPSVRSGGGAKAGE